MKILRIRAEGLPLYNAPFDIRFYAVQRVHNSHLDALQRLFGNIYVNTVEAIIGINASGKTTALQIISFTRMLLEATPLNAAYVPQILENDQPATFDIDFYAKGKLYHLRSEIIRTGRDDGSYSVKINKEQLWEKAITSRVNKTNLLNFEGIDPQRIRNNSAEYLPDDVSIMIAVNKQLQEKNIFVNLVGLTNINLFLPVNRGSIPTEIITLLDPTIEYITVDNVDGKSIIKLKFYESPEIVLHNPGELNYYLSSGTVKGVRVFSDAVKVLKNGGYLIVDEIENHFNHELVAALLRLFMDKKTNPKGAVIIFSTHYPELLDEIDRNDAVFITRNNQGLRIDNLNQLLSRNDMKKSEVYQSNFLEGTAPKYQALRALQKSIIRELGD